MKQGGTSRSFSSELDTLECCKTDSLQDFDGSNSINNEKPFFIVAHFISLSLPPKFIRRSCLEPCMESLENRIN